MLVLRVTGTGLIASPLMVSLLLITLKGLQRIHLITVSVGIRTGESGKVELRMSAIRHRIRQAAACEIKPNSESSVPT